MYKTIAIEDLKALRYSSGSSPKHARRALLEADGDLEEAAEILRQRGQSNPVLPSGSL